MECMREFSLNSREPSVCSIRQLSIRGCDSYREYRKNTKATRDFEHANEM